MFKSQISVTGSFALINTPEFSDKYRVSGLDDQYPVFFLISGT
jgi:hypothetical protein